MAHQRMCHLCQAIITDLMNMEDAAVFFRPVDPLEEGATGYYRIVVAPMCFMTIQEKLDEDGYQAFEEFIADIRQIWVNAQLFNRPSHAINKIAVRMSAQFELLIAALPHTITDTGKLSCVQRLVELRFETYRAHANLSNNKLAI
jgi:hypothetical protein